MTELGIPLLILFYHPDHTEVKELFKSRVEDELKDHRGMYTGATTSYMYIQSRVNIMCVYTSDMISTSHMLQHIHC